MHIHMMHIPFDSVIKTMSLLRNIYFIVILSITVVQSGVLHAPEVFNVLAMKLVYKIIEADLFNDTF